MADTFSFPGLYIGTVMITDTEKRRVGVYIPKIMSALYNGDTQQYTVPTNNGLQNVSFSTNINKQITKINYIWVKSWYYHQGLPDVGSKVAVWFIDGNLQLGFWKKFDPNGDYAVIPEEAHVKQFDLNINNINQGIYSDTSVSFELPEYFNIVSYNDEESRNTRFVFNENYNFYKGNSLIDSINDLQKSMEFITNRVSNTFSATLEKITFPEMKTISSPGEDGTITETGVIKKETYDYLKKVFDNDSSNMINNFATYTNLLDMNTFFNTAYSLLNSLVSVYKRYENYITKYNALSDKTLVPHDLDYFENIIKNLFDSISSAKLSEAASIDKQLALYFPTTPTVVLSYMEKMGNKEDKASTNKSLTLSFNAFSVFSDSNIIQQDDTTTVTIPESVVYSGNLSEDGNTNNSVIFIGWKDSQNNIYKKDTSIIYENVNLTPAFVGFDLSFNADRIVIINDDFKNKTFDANFTYYFDDNAPDTSTPITYVDVSTLNTAFSEFINDTSKKSMTIKMSNPYSEGSPLTYTLEKPAEV